MKTEQKTMYRRSYDIKPFEIISETDKTVTFMNGTRKDREKIVTQYYSWHNTFEDAVMALKQIEFDRIKRAELSIEYAKGNLQKIFDKYRI